MSIKLVSGITEIEDYLEPSREIVLVDMTLDSNGIMVNVEPALASRHPELNEVLICGGATVPERMFFEASGLSISSQMNGWTGVVKAFTYCDKENLSMVRSEFANKARGTLEGRVILLKRNLSECRQALKHDGR